LQTFNQLGLSEDILEVLQEIGFETPTPIQEQAIPLLLTTEKPDFIGLAQTGTGKTAAFGLPLLDLIDASASRTQALIMAPTRELGQQIANQLVTFARNLPQLNIEVVYGGKPIISNIRALRKPVQILVATPGRLLDLIRRGAVKLDQVEYVVLDEADEMLNMGFKEDIDAILDETGEQRSIWLFSATMPPAIRRIVTNYMDDPMEVKVNAQQISNKDITHQYVVTKVAHKIPALRRFLDIQPDMRGVLFCRTRRETTQIASELGDLGYNVAALNGDMSQAQRDQVMRQFKTRAMQLLVATDVAARGIDVQDLTHVVHHTLPDQIEYYTHRSGRTGRAGKKGISLVFIHPNQRRRIKDLEHRIKIQFEAVEVPSHEEVLTHRIRRWASHIIEAPVHRRATEFLEGLQDQLEDLSKEDLLERLISGQLDRLMVRGEEEGDLNVRRKKRERDRERAPERGGERGPNRAERRRAFEEERSEANHSRRYFINVGTMDGATVYELVQFIAETSGIAPQDISRVSLQKNCAYFDVPESLDKGLSNKFRGVTVEGRPIRVNRDLERNRPGKGPKKGKKGKRNGDRIKAKKKKKGKKGKF